MTVSIKALITSAFLFLALSVNAANCPPPTNAERVEVDRVFDGDTLQLRDGRRVRLIGINAPEMGYEGTPNQPLALQAKHAVENFVDDSDGLLMVIGSKSRDRYRRTLAHLYDDQGISLEETLIEEGLAFRISLPPNLALRECLARTERAARDQQRGVWSLPQYQPIAAGDLDASHGGFQRVSGRVTEVGQGKHSRHLVLDNRLFVLIEEHHLRYFQKFDLDGLLSRTLTLRGWVIPRTLSASQKRRGFRPFMLRLAHPDAIDPRPSPHK